MHVCDANSKETVVPYVEKSVHFKQVFFTYILVDLQISYTNGLAVAYHEVQRHAHTQHPYVRILHRSLLEQEDPNE